MVRIAEAQIDARVVKVYQAEGVGLPVVYSNDYQECGEAVLARCAELGCRPFHLVTVSKVGWDRSMSPWPSAPVVARNDRFTGEGPAYLEWLLGKTVPHAEQILGIGDAASFIVGYSMAGLFALWSLYRTGLFAGAASVSGSVWFPDFREFAIGHDLAGSPRGIYLSLGDRETQVENPALQHTDAICRELCDHYEAADIPTTFELNPGNHYQNMDLRVAKGIAWLLDTALV